MDLAAAASAGVPVVRRFSGGGSVVVDSGTLLVGLAGPAAAVVGEGGAGGGPAGGRGPDLGPRALMAWTEGVYRPVFGGVGPFALRENGEEREKRERGGKNRVRAPSSFFSLSPHTRVRALFLPSPRPLQTTSSATSSSGATPRPSPRGGGCTTREWTGGFEGGSKKKKMDKARGLGLLGGVGPTPPRFFFCSRPPPPPPRPLPRSFLWDYSPSRMALLRHPARAPAYRAGRPHAGFVTSLRAEAAKNGAAAATTRRGLLAALPAALEGVGFTVLPTTLEEAEDVLLGTAHHRTTRVLVGGDGRAA